MAGSKVTPPDEITSDEFGEALARYAGLIRDLSSTKGAKPGQQSLEQLDHYRYVEAVDEFGSEKRPKKMELKQVETLVNWKLRHGTFRPTLMKLVSSNEAAVVKSTVAKAVAAYRESGNTSAAIKTLCELKGIGPATASLLLAVHDPENIIFFSDEAFWWLCCDGKKDTIKYNAKEYEILAAKSRELANRLGVEAVEVEKASFVIMKEGLASAPGTSAPKAKPVASAKAPSSAPIGSKEAKPPQAKRKRATGLDAETQSSSRRSKRGKSS